MAIEFSYIHFLDIKLIDFKYIKWRNISKQLLLKTSSLPLFVFSHPHSLTHTLTHTHKAFLQSYDLVTFDTAFIGGVCLCYKK